MLSNHIPQKLTKDISLVPCKLSQDGKSFTPIFTPLNHSELKNLKSQPWTKQEDDILTQMASSSEKWSLISSELNKQFYNSVLVRSQKQCRERWKNYLNPNLLKNPFTKCEDELILFYYKKYRSWARVAKKLKNRNENQIKNRYRSLHSKRYQNKKKAVQKASKNYLSQCDLSIFSELNSISSMNIYTSSLNLGSCPMESVITPNISENPSLVFNYNENGFILASPSISQTLLLDPMAGLNIFPENQPDLKKYETILDDFCDI